MPLLRNQMPGRTSENSTCHTEGVDRATVWAALQSEQQVVTEPEVQSKSNPQAVTELEVVAEKETDGDSVDIDKEIHELAKMLKEVGPQAVIFREQLAKLMRKKDKALRILRVLFFRKADHKLPSFGSYMRI